MNVQRPWNWLYPLLLCTELPGTEESFLPLFHLLVCLLWCWDQMQASCLLGLCFSAELQARSPDFSFVLNYKNDLHCSQLSPMTMKLCGGLGQWKATFRWQGRYSLFGICPSLPPMDQRCVFLLTHSIFFLFLHRICYRTCLKVVFIFSQVFQVIFGVLWSLRTTLLMQWWGGCAYVL